MGKKMEVAYKTDWRSLYILTIVAFLGAFKVGTNSSSLWPYIQLHDSTVTETFFGYMISISNVGNLVAAFIFGWLSNQFQHTKPAILLGKVLALIGAVMYLSVELVDTNQRMLFIAMEVFFGLGLGASSVARTYVSMASTEKSRPRAFGMISLAHTLGHATGPFVMALMTRLKYPGYQFGSTGLHLNLYSAPIYLLIFTIIVSVVLLILYFDGKMRLMKNVQPVEKEIGIDGKKPKTIIDPSTLPKGERFDKLAVFVCCSTRFLMTIGMVYGHSLSSPYMMTAFQWDGPKLVLISSIMNTLIGLIGVAWSLVYISGWMKNRLSERRAIVIAIIMKLLFFLITYPWPVYEKTIAYEVVAMNETTGKVTVLEHGCKLSHDWCKYTPAINPFVYCIAKVVLLGISMPLMHLNLEILYSKVLGHIKQGTMQGFFIICGDILQVIGPIIMTQVYQHYGVKWVWLMIIAFMVIILALWLIFYQRMISSSRRMQQIVDASEMDTE